MLQRFFKSRLPKIAFIVIALLIIISIVLNYTLSFRTPDTKAVKEFASLGLHLSTRTIPINGHNIHYVSVGNDTLPTIVFVHGSPGSWTAFENYLKDTALLSKFRLISFDRPGFGYSDYGHAMNLQNECDLIAVVLQQLQNGKPLYLVGHSMGGPVVAELAADHPTLLQGIVILAGALDPSVEPAENWRKLFLNKPWCYLLPGAFMPSNEELWQLKKDYYPLQQKLPQITCRVYVLHGQKDMLVDVQNAAFMKAHITKAKSYFQKIFPNENHFIPWTQYDTVKQLLLTLPQSQ